MEKWFALAGIVVLVDQLLKALIVSTTAVGQRHLAGLVTLAYNSGVTFGFLQGTNAWVAAVSVVAAVAIGYALLQSEGLEGIGFSLLLGGILGNLVDRAVRGAVVDYISIGRFPVFNLADSCIVVGVALLLLSELPPVKRALRTRRTRPSRRGSPRA